MAKNNKDNPIAVYSVVSQIGLIIILPLLFFIWGGSWLVEKLEWPEWVNIIFVVMGILTMVSGAWTYLKRLMKMYDKSERTKFTELQHDPKDNDYYDESRKGK